MKYLIDASLPGIETYFGDCQVTLYQNPLELQNNLSTHDILLCRSTLTVNESLLKNSTIQTVATASSGIDHIDVLYLAQRQIALVDAKGANSEAVADYVEAVLAYLKQQGHKLDPVGIIGMGKVGALVNARLQCLGLSTKTYDPLREANFNSCHITDLYDCPIITLHANLHDILPFPSKHMINHDFLNNMLPHSVIINAARGCLVDEEALVGCRKPLYYCTDVYENEPHIRRQILQCATLCTPHIAGHSIEAKLAVMQMLRNKIDAIYSSMPIISSDTLTLTLPRREQSILSLYNPAIESQQLKKAINIAQTFLTLRARHQRHLFSYLAANRALI